MVHNFFPAKRYKWTTYSLEFIKEMLIKRRDNERDCIVLITGSRGEGKSTLVGKILFQFEDFNPYESLVYSKEALFKQLKKKRNYIWADEAVVSSAKGNTQSRSNKLLFEACTINRDNFNILFLVIPNIEDFDSKILQYCCMWLFIDRRGLSAVFLPANKGIFGKKNWNVDNLKKHYEEIIKERKEGSKIPLWCFENFRGYIRFGKLPKHQQEIIDEIKSMRKNENLDKEMKENVVFQAKEVENYSKYSARNLSELIIKGEIRNMESFTKTCEEYKLLPDEMIQKCDNILKKNNIGKTVKGIFRDNNKQDSLIRF